MYNPAKAGNSLLGQRIDQRKRKKRCVSKMSKKAPTALGKIVGIVAACAATITFLVGAAGGIQYLKAPRVNAIPSGPLSLSYDAEKNLLKLGFHLTLDNSGYGSEVISSTNARLVNDALPPYENYIPFTINDLIFKEKPGDPDQSAPIVVDKESTRKLECFLRHNPGGISSGVIETRGKLHLYVNLFGKKKYVGMFGEERLYPLEFCFESDGSKLKILAKHPLLFNSVSCN